MTRACGTCTLCCKLLPMVPDQHVISKYPETIAAGLITANDLDRALPSFAKPAGARCPHQSHSKGCKVYDRRPFACRLWNCAWLINDDTGDLSRPDRAHYVIDIMPDFVTMQDNETGEKFEVPVIQVWLDPNYPDAHRDPALRAYLDAKATAALVRLDSKRAFTIFPPSVAADGEWHEMNSDSAPEGQHSAAAVRKVLEATGRM